jgi:hypothetical protein
MTAAKKRLLIELIATGIASPVLLIVMILMRKLLFIGLLTRVVTPLGQVLGDWMNKVSPPDGSAWAAPLGNVLLADMILECILIWILLMTAVKMLQRFVLKRRNA